MSRVLESLVMSSAVTRLNIPVTHSWKSWMEKIRTGVSWSQYTVLVSNYITRIEMRIKRRQIITNVVLPSRWGISVCWKKATSNSRVIESRDTKENNIIGGTIPPINHDFLR